MVSEVGMKCNENTASFEDVLIIPPDNNDDEAIVVIDDGNEDEITDPNKVVQEVVDEEEENKIRIEKIKFSCLYSAASSVEINHLYDENKVHRLLKKKYRRKKNKRKMQLVPEEVDLDTVLLDKCMSTQALRMLIQTLKEKDFTTNRKRIINPLHIEWFQARYSSFKESPLDGKKSKFWFDYESRWAVKKSRDQGGAFGVIKFLTARYQELVKRFIKYIYFTCIYICNVYVVCSW